MATESLILPAEHNFIVKKGDTFLVSFEHVIPQTSPAPALPLDLTGATVLFQVRNKPNGTLLLSKSTADIGGELQIQGVNSNIVSTNFDIDIAAGDWVWEIEITFPVTLVRRTTMGGAFAVVEEVAEQTV